MDTPKFTLTDDDIVTVYLSSNSANSSGVTSSPVDNKHNEENDVYDGSDDDGDE